MAAPRAVRIKLSADERATLERRVRRRNIARADAQRAEIVLKAADGANNSEIAAAVGVTRQTVRIWRVRFAEQRLDGLSDEPRCGAPRRIDDDRIEAIIVKTLEAKPANATHWSTRDMAKAVGISTSSVHRIWRAFSLQPHRAETFKLSSDPQFVEKVRDIVGLYLDPPDKALVICVDEKSQIQALDRTQPLLPMRPGQIERRTHDYERHGTTTLFAGFIAAVNAPATIRAGEVIGRCKSRHRSSEFRAFLDEVENNVPTEFDIHVVMDNASSHKTKMIRDWFAKRPRWHMHFTPTSSSWLNQVERFFALLSQKQIKRGAHSSVKALIKDIESFIEKHNVNPTPLRWTKSADDILASIERFCRRTLDTQPKGG
ncbi:IS630 family transposase [Sphingobium yanoikuyae]|uniref:IS630 family transposase n=1 Tax=Sphingobium yanoikuyae TaxID=13690 RepID=A0A6P1GD62_SPHYA|nr:IS630 family transposase [Sphingobium yanoikuyae]QHD65764.1 IS630 family transposase [Sphingobium yanoikuyae]QHD66456.1 IS630 family transposase [Sphingobium yanoikuyae]QHD66873.1 IS630 family transposase [Sphingobium yanoikuyae]